MKVNSNLDIKIFTIGCLLLINSLVYSQGYSTSTSTGAEVGCDNPGFAPIYTSFVNYNVNRNINGKPISVSVTSRCLIFDDQFPPPFPNVNCTSSYSFPLPDFDCYSDVYNIGSCTSTELTISWQPSNLTISGSTPKVYCADEKNNSRCTQLL